MVGQGRAEVGQFGESSRKAQRFGSIGTTLQRVFISSEWVCPNPAARDPVGPRSKESSEASGRGATGWDAGCPADGLSEVWTLGESSNVKKVLIAREFKFVFRTLEFIRDVVFQIGPARGR